MGLPSVYSTGPPTIHGSPMGFYESLMGLYYWPMGLPWVTYGSPLGIPRVSHGIIVLAHGPSMARAWVNHGTRMG